LELIPLDDPSAIRPGTSLRLRVLFRGSPLAGAQVDRDEGLTVTAKSRRLFNATLWLVVAGT